MNDLKDKNIIITGSNRGLGRAAVEAFAAEGANVWACARKETPEFAADMKSVAEKYRVEIEPLYFDLTDHEAMKAAIMTIAAEKRRARRGRNCQFNNGENEMNNNEKYVSAFVNAFEITADETAGLKYQQIPAWDSVGHMGLIAQLEEQFGIMFEPDDIIDLSSFEKGKEILAAKYGVEF